MTTSDVVEYVIVWRETAGAAVRTFAHADKSPRVFTDLSASEAEGADAINDDAFAALLENREEFSPKRVSVAAAQELLGWSI